MAQAKKNKGKPKAKAAAETTSLFSTNRYGVVQHDDGNPSTPDAFMAENPTDEEMYFNPEDDAIEAIKNRCKILNFIHRGLHFDTLRSIPAVLPSDNEAIETYHRATFMSVSYDVCVIYPKRQGEEYKECIALVKRTSDDLLGEGALDAVVCSDAAWTPEAIKDSITIVIDGLDCNYWCPRWKYLVKYLRDRMAHDYDKHGNEIHPQVPSDIPRGTSMHVGGGAAAVYDNGEIIEDVTQICSGATGKVIGPKGSKLFEIKDATGVKDIIMPTKVEGGERPRARDPVDVSLKGTRTQINAAIAMIQAVNDEWKNAPRPNRDGGYSSAAVPDYSADNGGGNGGDNTGGTVDWADDANEQADWEKPSGGAAVIAEGNWAGNSGSW